MNETDKPLAGRSAIITGASRGIGNAIALRLASAGAHAIIGARSLDQAAGAFAGTIHETAAEIRALGGHATPLAVDMTDAASREAFIKDAISAAGKIDILVNNAGTAVYKKTWDFSHAEGLSQIEAYFTGPWHLCNLLLPHMIAGGGGSILNLGSSSVIKTPQPPYERHLQYFGNDVLYAALKAAIHRFSQGLAAEVFQHNITVNVLAPVGGVFTPGLDALGLGFSPDHAACEIVEQMAEAALDLVSRPVAQGTGRVAWSHKYLDEIGRPTMSLDGRSVLVARRGAAHE